MTAYAINLRDWTACMHVDEGSFRLFLSLLDRCKAVWVEPGIEPGIRLDCDETLAKVVVEKLQGRYGAQALRCYLADGDGAWKLIEERQKCPTRLI